MTNEENKTKATLRRATEYLHDGLVYTVDIYNTAAAGVGNCDCANGVQDLEEIRDHASDLLAVIRETQKAIEKAEDLDDVRLERDQLAETLKATTAELEDATKRIAEHEEDLARARKMRDLAITTIKRGKNGVAKAVQS
jgi:septal ring factor EnvC (AmiA/AmiB activator)